MNVKKVLTITLVALIACFAFAGVASAFTVTQDAKSIPSGALVAGDTLVTTLQIKVVADEMSIESSLGFSSDLEPTSTSIKVDIYKSDGTSYLTTTYPSSTNYKISGYNLGGYGSDLVLDIEVSGVVSATSAGKYITPVTISVTNPKVVSGDSSYSAPKQMVYDVTSLSSTLQSLINEITSLEATINEINASVPGGCDCSEARGHLEKARTNYQAAVSAGVANGATAFAKIEESLTHLKNAKSSLAFVSLTIIQTKITEINDIILQLYSKGWNTEAKIGENGVAKIEKTYDSCEKAYLANDPNNGEISVLLVDTINLYNELSAYLEDSENVFGGVTGILPYILIGVGVIVVGVVVFFIIRKRKGNSWDELG